MRAIGLHIEGLQDIPRFERAALKALANGIPVVALKTGSSAIGSAADGPAIPDHYPARPSFMRHCLSELVSLALPTPRSFWKRSSSSV